MAVTANDLQVKYNQHLTNKNAKSITIATYVVFDNGRVLWRDTPDAGPRYYTSNMANHPGQRHGYLPEAQAAALITSHESLTFGQGAQHRLRAKADARWCHMYHCLPRNPLFLMAGAVGPGVPSPNQIMTIPCHYCGIILPLGLIQVDHKQPKAGQSGLWIFKTLHSLNAGLTRAPASGIKNSQTAQIVAGGPANGLHTGAREGPAIRPSLVSLAAPAARRAGIGPIQHDRRGDYVSDDRSHGAGAAAVRE